MKSLEILRAMGPDNYKKNSLKLAEEILEKLKDFAPKLISEYEKNSEVCEWNKRSNQKSINEIMEIMGKFENKVVSNEYGDPIIFNQTSQFREPFSLRMDLINGRHEKIWMHPGTEQLVEIGEDLWQRTGDGHVIVNDGLNKEQIEFLWMIKFKQTMQKYHDNYVSALVELRRFNIDPKIIDLTEFDRKIDQANTEYWESRKKLHDFGFCLDALRDDKQVSKRKAEIENEIVRHKERVRSAKWNYETRKKNLEDQGLDPDNFDLWGVAGT